VLLLPDAQLSERRHVTREGDLGALYDSLSAELTPLLERELFVPEQKALLSKQGGRCEREGTSLEFDPWSPEEHRCPKCGAVFTGELHHRAWIMPYQLWLAERAVHAALFFALRGEQRHGELAERILAAYADRYLSYSNVDNVLGPTRLFFSTYLESIWLLQICVATDLLRAAGRQTLHDRVVAQIVEPSRAIIGGFDEGMSNRQVWNNAALLAAAVLLGDDRAFDDRFRGRASSLRGHLTDALFSDGTWYEGENYHQFALRGLWYGVTIAESRGDALDDKLRGRFDRAFDVLYLTALPDFTMPSRKDSQYATSLRQWRIAEMAELGFARTRSSLLAGSLARTYEPGHERVDTGRARSAADVERNVASGALTRADLGWRALLRAVPALPPTVPRQPQSALLEQQGLAVFRRSPDVYATLDYGSYGGGHGHPDRLNLTLAIGEDRILDDLGTGSYVDPSLHWYRSTLAHNAPLVNGRSQPEADGLLKAHDERGALGWTLAVVDWPELRVRVERAVVVAPDYLIDEVRWTSDRDVRFELPWHFDGQTSLPLRPTQLDGADGLEDGFAFAKEVRHAPVRRGDMAEIRDGPVLARLVSDSDAEIFGVTAPGQPASRDQRFHLLRANGKTGRFRALVSWSDVRSAAFTENGVEVHLGDGSRHAHKRDDQGWHVELFAEGARSSVDLSGFREPGRASMPAPATARPISLRRDEEIQFAMGADNYRRSETDWKEAGAPAATVGIRVGQSALELTVDVRAADQRFSAADAVNPYDNEPADTMSAGVQVYLEIRENKGAWMIIPEHNGNVRVRPIQDWNGVSHRPRAQFTPTARGYSLQIIFSDWRATEFALDVIVNDAVAGRERRRGQLVLSGAAGEFVYLRGDRHDESRLLNFRVDP
jgi:hypothetical protein